MPSEDMQKREKAAQFYLLFCINVFALWGCFFFQFHTEILFPVEVGQDTMTSTCFWKLRQIDSTQQSGCSIQMPYWLPIQSTEKFQMWTHSSKISYVWTSSCQEAGTTHGHGRPSMPMYWYSPTRKHTPSEPCPSGGHNVVKFPESVMFNTGPEMHLGAGCRFCWALSIPGI